MQCLMGICHQYVLPLQNFLHPQSLIILGERDFSVSCLFYMK